MCQWEKGREGDGCFGWLGHARPSGHRPIAGRGRVKGKWAGCGSAGPEAAHRGEKEERRGRVTGWGRAGAGLGPLRRVHRFPIS